MPLQWINCDIRKLDFKSIGKFAAVIADPPWNIHMNVSKIFNYTLKHLINHISYPMELATIQNC